MQVRRCVVQSLAVLCLVVMVCLAVPGCGAPDPERAAFREDAIAFADESVAVLEAAKAIGPAEGELTPEADAALDEALDEVIEDAAVLEAAAPDPQLAATAAAVRVIADQITKDPDKTVEHIDRTIELIETFKTAVASVVAADGSFNPDGITAVGAHVAPLLPGPWGGAVLVGSLGLNALLGWLAKRKTKEAKNNQRALEIKVDGITEFLKNGSDPVAKEALKSHLKAAENADIRTHLAKAKA